MIFMKTHFVVFSCLETILKGFWFVDKYVDHDLQFDKSFLEPLRIILDSIGWKVERTANLESFFV